MCEKKHLLRRSAQIPPALNWSSSEWWNSWGLDFHEHYILYKPRRLFEDGHRHRAQGDNLEKQDRVRHLANSKGQNYSCWDGETLGLWFTSCSLCLADGQLAPGRTHPTAHAEPPHSPFSTTFCTITPFVKADEEIMAWREQIGQSWLRLVSRMLTANCGLREEGGDLGTDGGMGMGHGPVYLAKNI